MRAGAGEVTEYLLTQAGVPDLERTRLRLLEEFHDPLSAAQLDAIGVAPGWRCLDVGAGGGSVTRMLAERVGPAGSVLSLDLDTTLLEPLAGRRVEVRRHDIRSDQLPDAAFDLVHARLLLMHLPARVRALDTLAAAARPGAWLAVVDPDFTTVAVSPSDSIWERSWSIFLDALVAGGWDPRYGARLETDLRAAGLIDVHVESVSSRGPGGTPPLRLLSLTLERLRERMRGLGAADAEIDHARQQLEDPGRMISSQATYVARGRRAG